MTVETGQVRDCSIRVAKRLGYRISESLPLAEEGIVRPIGEVVDRALALNAVIAVAWGLPRADAVAWLENERLFGALTTKEVDFVRTDVGERNDFRTYTESLWVLAWALSFIPKLEFDRICGDELAHLFPSILRNGSSKNFRQSAAMRSTEDLITAKDLAYCLHWSIVDARVHGEPFPGKLHPLVIISRRRALEWLASTEAWDEVAMDT